MVLGEGGAACAEALRLRMRHIAAVTTTARQRLSTMDGKDQRLWSDVPPRKDAGDVREVFVRLRSMALAYRTPGSELYGHVGLGEAIQQGLVSAYSAKYNESMPLYGNWWHWEIGAPLALLDTLLLMGSDIEPGLLAAYLRAVARCTPAPESFGQTTRSESKVSTGANRVWKSRVYALTSLLLSDKAGMCRARDVLDPVFEDVVSGDGFYADGSFIQHARHPYTGCYGTTLLLELSEMVYALNGSPWEVRGEHVCIMSRWVEKAFKPLMYKGLMLDMVSGRAISRYKEQGHAKGHKTTDAVLRIAAVAPSEEAAKLKRLAKQWLTLHTYSDYVERAPLDLAAAASELLNDNSIVPAEELPSCKLFPAMDRAVHRRNRFLFGLSMHSSRISSYESINGENMHGWHTSHGMTYVYNDDQGHYCDGFWPTVDPYRLPGTTVSDQLRRRGSGHAGPSVCSFVGGVSNGLNGAAAMELREPGVYAARKSWFMFGNTVVALGSAICVETSARLETVIDNRLLREDDAGAVTFAVDGAEYTLERGKPMKVSPLWAHLKGRVPGADIGYYFPRPQAVRMLCETRIGSWRDINEDGPDEPVERSYFTAWLDHGSPELSAPADYAYMLLPGRSAAETAAFAAGPKPQIVALTSEVHAVRDEALGLTGFHFWGETWGTAGPLSCSTRATVLLQEEGETLELLIADPTQVNEGDIELELSIPVSAVIEADERLTVHSLQPSVRLVLHASGTMGQPCRIRLARAYKL